MSSNTKRKKKENREFNLSGPDRWSKNRTIVFLGGPLRLRYRRK